jgi:hypothetical protein
MGIGMAQSICKPLQVKNVKFRRTRNDSLIPRRPRTHQETFTPTSITLSLFGRKLRGLSLLNPFRLSMAYHFSAAFSEILHTSVPFIGVSIISVRGIPCY